MKKTILLIPLFLAGLVTAQLPDVEVRNVDSESINLNDLKGEKLTVVDFWATWCKPCISAIPKLNILYSDFSERGVEFIGVNVDGPRNQSKVKPFAASVGIKYPLLLDPDQELVNDFNVTAFPTLLVFNHKGEEVYSHEGFTPGDEVLIRKKLESLLEK